MRASRTLVCSGLVLVMCAAPVASAQTFPTLTGAKPLVVGHRGASGVLPEHTLEAYRTAIAMGADVIEPDLVSTKDGVLIARHEPDLTNTTNVKSLPQFADRKKTVVIDTVSYTGWFANDFTLAEIKTLRAIQQRAGRSKKFDNAFEIPTFAEVIDLAKKESTRLGRPISVYPETKHPIWHAQQSLALEPKLVAALAAAGWTTKSDPVIVQSFEIANLKTLRAQTGVRLVQLLSAYDNDINTGRPIYLPKDPDSAPYDFIAANDTRTYADMITPAGLAEIKTYADGIGPWKRQFIGVKGIDRTGDGKADDINGDGAVNEADGVSDAFSTLVADAHAAGLFVHPYTLRDDVPLAMDYAKDPQQELRQLYALGVDGLFTDFPDSAYAAREALAAGVVTAVEYRLPGTNRYVRTIDQGEQAAIARGDVGGWQMTTDSFRAWQTAAANPSSSPVCRVFVPTPLRHLFSIVASECAAYRALAGAIDEGTAFHAVAVPGSGTCPTGTAPIDRLRITTDGTAYERYVGSSAESAALVAAGWTRVGVGFCGAA